MSRRIQVLAALCVTLASWALATRPTPLARPTEVRLPAFDTLARISVTRTGDPEVVLERQGPSWRVGDAPADTFAMEAVAEVLAQPLVLDPVGPATDLGRYALTDDALTIDLGEGGRWRLGKVVDGRHTFVRRADDTLVYRARGHLRRAFDRPAERWREHRLFPGRGPADVARLVARRGDAVEWAAARTSPDAAWAFEVPPTDDAGQAELHAVANTLSTSKAAGYVDGEGFQPLTRLEATGFDGARFGIEIGPRAQDGSGAVRRLSDGVVASLPNHLLTFLDVRASELRDRRIFSFDSSLLSAAKVGEELRVERREDGWWAVAPRVVALQPDAAKSYVDAVVHLRAAGFPKRVPDDAFTRPFGSIHLRVDPDHAVTVTLGAEYGKNARYARTSERPERVFVLSGGTVARLLPTLDALLVEPRFGP